MARRPGDRGDGKGLTSEDREVWSRVARSATPLHPVAAHEPAPDIRPVPRVVSPRVVTDLSALRIGSAGRPQPRAFAPQPSPAQMLSEADLRMDSKIHRRMTQGKLRPQARLDLHGMTLSAAQPELFDFVMSCHAGGLRLVLVITGKGRGDHGPLPTRPGALRHQVPHWLLAPPLSAMVQQVNAAHFRHGGEGAYYVYLRRRPG